LITNFNDANSSRFDWFKETTGDGLPEGPFE
jgi:hypothetical protein